MKVFMVLISINYLNDTLTAGGNNFCITEDRTVEL